MSSTNQINPISAFILSVLSEKSEEKSTVWLAQKREKILISGKEMDFFMAFSQASRYFKKNPLNLTEDQINEIQSLSPGLRIDLWDQLQLARVYLLLQYPAADAASWKNTLQKLFETGDMYEIEALYAALPIMPYAEEMVARAREGLRTNITSVFDAVALNNPYPATYFDESAWNQMVVKAIFMQRPLFKIQNAEQRANQELADIIIDFAHERWSAGRDVIPELWRFVGPFISEKNLKDIKKVVSSENKLERKAALLACSMSDFSEAKDLINEYPEIKKDIDSGHLTWELIGQETLEKALS
ncbi:EboA domain-containing protein [Algoriphagus pacificus]|uniref:EboA domain-containing protein n=1 Tax=Algoriphagus pacificus TaxID=2811234 RepID=A0ABS3CIW1_9BACT|nr:EboA domain-containing protein [Algoriphagus pacificus]MBN7817039.1 EboA domain-containing protein [Algoriphagus pacificus]